jgi:hypothetical protein
MKVKSHHIVLGIISLTCIGLVGPSMVHVFISAKVTALWSQNMTRIRQLATSLTIYSADFDERCPHATTMQSHRALISPYVSDIDAFKKVENSTTPQFNFNMAGVKLEDTPINPIRPVDRFDNQANPLYFAIQHRGAYPDLFIAYSDLSVIHREISDVFGPSMIFSPQYDRKGVTLAHADYLADQDPLKK